MSDNRRMTLCPESDLSRDIGSKAIRFGTVHLLQLSDGINDIAVADIAAEDAVAKKADKTKLAAVANMAFAANNAASRALGRMDALTPAGIGAVAAPGKDDKEKYLVTGSGLIKFTGGGGTISELPTSSVFEGAGDGLTTQADINIDFRANFAAARSDVSLLQDQTGNLASVNIAFAGCLAAIRSELGDKAMKTHAHDTATAEDVKAGIDDAKYITPKALADAGILGGTLIDEITTSGTYTFKRSGLALVVAIGGGGSGCIGTFARYGGGAAGGSGGVVEVFTLVNSGVVASVTIGAGGSRPTAEANPGNGGGGTKITFSGMSIEAGGGGGAGCNGNSGGSGGGGGGETFASGTAGMPMGDGTGGYKSGRGGNGGGLNAGVGGASVPDSSGQAAAGNNGGDGKGRGGEGAKAAPAKALGGVVPSTFGNARNYGKGGNGGNTSVSTQSGGSGAVLVIYP